jgi:NAD(P)-dependent dehydrogenase (short-subunit alcohol dehydrogenase family)
MAEPIVLVTGSTDGTGRATARVLAIRGAEGIIHGRDQKKRAGRSILRKEFITLEMDRYVWLKKNYHAGSAWNVPISTILRKGIQKGGSLREPRLKTFLIPGDVRNAG